MTRMIVTGVDASETAFKAAQKAAQLAADSGAVLHICTAYSSASSDALSEAQSAQNSNRVISAEFQKLIDGVADASLRVAESVAEILRQSHPALTIEVSSMAGTPSDVLLHKAEALNADVIVVGNKNIKGVSRILGSVARKVASGATCDLYIANTTH